MKTQRLGPPLPQRRPLRQHCSTDIRLLRVLDEHMRQCLVIAEVGSVARQDVILALSRLIAILGKPVTICSEQGTEFTANAVIDCLCDRRAGPAFIPLGRHLHKWFVETLMQGRAITDRAASGSGICAKPEC